MPLPFSFLTSIQIPDDCVRVQVNGLSILAQLPDHQIVCVSEIVNRPRIPQGRFWLHKVPADLMARRIDYEEYLKRIAEISRQVLAGKGDDTPPSLDTPGKRALFGALGDREELALRIDETVKKVRPAEWRGHPAREKTIKQALLPLLGNDKAEVERIFLILNAQAEY